MLGWQATQAQEVLTLEEAIRQGLENNFAIQVAQNDQQVVTNDNRAGNAGMLPTLDLEASKSYQRQNVDLEIQGSEGTFNVSRDWAKSDRLNAAARLNWTIFDGLGMFMAKNRLRSIQEWGELNTQQAVKLGLALQARIEELTPASIRALVEQASSLPDYPAASRRAIDSFEQTTPLSDVIRTLERALSRGEEET